MSEDSLARILLQILSSVRLRKAQALLYFLLADQGGVHRSDKIIDLFWQESDQQKASSSYRQVIRHIRRELDATQEISLETGFGAVSLRLPGGFSFQNEVATGLAAAGWSEETAEILREFMGYTLRLEGLSSSFDSWLVITRNNLLSLLRKTLDERMKTTDGARLAELRAPAEFALGLEPANETAVRILMTLDWQSGHSTRAIERYNLLYAHLDEEYDQEPEPETIELLAAIKLSPAAGAVQKQVVNRRPEVSLSVGLMPGEGIPAEMVSFGTVLFSDIRMRMGRFREWRVLDDEGTETAQARVTLRPIYALQAYRLFIEVQRGTDRQLLWSEMIESPESDWESKARRLLSNIANALSVVVSDRSLSESGAHIYDRWLKAQTLLDDWSPQTENAAMVMLEEITREAPRFGPAHAELAGALNVRHVLLPGTRPSDEVNQRALHHAIVAVSIDPLDTRAHRVVAWCYCHKREFGLAEFHFDQSLNLNRSNPLTLASCALGFAFAGNPGRAASLVAETKAHAAVMEPFHLIYLAAADYLLGDYQAAAEECSRGGGLMPTVGGWHSLSLWKLGQEKEAVQRLRDYTAEIRGLWRGSAEPTDARILDWFGNCFPLRDAAAQADLRATLERVAQTAALAG
ncbi:BTAD domain-containing putative transcriptional regulator [uncultured Paracoccus sp.]|uniref:BTAD domain-containing putative transcriptional regulator n=1 Tax=uncultured Paracoccus sp. TaxID=189685 RepID=UPI0026335862|nr:BTAD domain-containing putative transcriptional regulator [uncultured Paracoccus sp.]